MTPRIDVLPAAISSTRRAVEPAARRTLRSVGAVLAGLATLFAISSLTDAALHATGIFPSAGVAMSDPLFALAATYRAVYGVLGCYLTAWLARSRPMLHALALGGVGLVASTLGTVAMWDAGPHWYSLLVVASVLPCAWLGGALRVRREGAVSRSARRRSAER